MKSLFTNGKRAVVIMAIALAAIIHLGLPLAMKNKGVSFSPPSDPLEYRVLAYHLVHDHRFTLHTHEEGSLPQLLRTPAYPLFIAFIETLSKDPLWIIIAQQLLLGLAAYLLYLTIKAKTNSTNISIVAGFLLLFEPLALFFSLQTWSESLFIFLLSVTLYLATKAKRTQDVLLLGITWGLLVLTRPMGILTAPILVLPFLERTSIPWKQGSVCLLGILAVFSPWLIRNARLTHSLTLSSSGLYNSVAGIYSQLAPDRLKPIHSRYELKQETLRHPEEPITGLKSKLYTTEGLATLKQMAEAGEKDISSWSFLKQQFVCQTAVWKDGWSGIIFEKYGKEHTLVLRSVANTLEYLFYGTLLLLGALALFSNRYRPSALALWLTIGAVSFMNVCIASTRMRTSILPLVLLLASLGAAKAFSKTSET